MIPEENITQSASYFRKVLNNIPNSVFVIEVTNDGKYRIQDVNTAQLRYLGKEKDEILGKTIDELLPGETAIRINKVYSKCVSKKKKISYEEEFTQPGSSKSYYLTTLTPICNESGKVTTLIGSSIDITDRKHMEQALQKSEEKYRSFVQNSTEGIYLFEFTQPFDIHLPVDQQIKKFYEHGYVSACNDALAKMYGFSSSNDLIGKKLIDFHGSDKDPRNLNFLTKLIQSGYNIKDEISVEKDKNGDTKYFLENINGVVQDGVLVRIWASQRDVTEQKISEQKLKTSLSEKKILLSEIHHRVKNNLAVVSGMMQLQAFDEKDETLRNKLYDSVVRIKTMATVHELLYQSQSFSNLEFSDTLKNLVQNVSETLQTSSNICVEIDCEPIRLNINQAIPASLIVNEVLTNAYKHAFPDAMSGTIMFTLSEKNNWISIEITDDGVGFNPDLTLDELKSLGTHLIKVLSEQINATYKYENRKDSKGTCFHLSFERTDTPGIGSAKIQ
ncbi:PAS domain S-box protein [Gracilimonas sp.]|uniref:PAS domain-containing sensor histidine kinase n=1 Tax=Gracilimonas sp. TaxID=1974203 RepID=UPI0032ED7C4F